MASSLSIKQSLRIILWHISFLLWNLKREKKQMFNYKSTQNIVFDKLHEIEKKLPVSNLRRTEVVQDGFALLLLAEPPCLFLLRTKWNTQGAIEAFSFFIKSPLGSTHTDIRIYIYLWRDESKKKLSSSYLEPYLLFFRGLLHCDDDGTVAFKQR